MATTTTPETLIECRALYLALLPVGTPLQGGSSSVTSHVLDRSGSLSAVVITRDATGSTVRATVRKGADTLRRIAAGEQIPKRAISYTSSVEACIVAGLGLSFDGRYTR